MENIVKEISYATEKHAVSLLADQIMKKIDAAGSYEERAELYCKIVDLAAKFYKEMDKEQADAIRRYVSNPENRWMKTLNQILDNTNPQYGKKLLMSLGYEAFFRGTRQIRESRLKYNCNIPWLILFDPTMACNMHCKGCWSGTYGRNQLAAIHADEYRRKQPLVSSTGKICRRALRQYEKRSSQQAALFKNSTSSYWHSEHDRSAEKCRPVNS